MKLYYKILQNLLHDFVPNFLIGIVFVTKYFTDRYSYSPVTGYNFLTDMMSRFLTFLKKVTCS